MERRTFKKEERGRKKNASDWICYVSETDRERDRERVGEEIDKLFYIHATIWNLKWGN